MIFRIPLLLFLFYQLSVITQLYGLSNRGPYSAQRASFTVFSIEIKEQGTLQPGALKAAGMHIKPWAMAFKHLFAFQVLYPA